MNFFEKSRCEDYLIIKGFLSILNEALCHNMEDIDMYYLLYGSKLYEIVKINKRKRTITIKPTTTVLTKELASQTYHQYYLEALGYKAVHLC